MHRPHITIPYLTLVGSIEYHLKVLAVRLQLCDVGKLYIGLTLPYPTLPSLTILGSMAYHLKALAVRLHLCDVGKLCIGLTLPYLTVPYLVRWRTSRHTSPV